MMGHGLGVTHRVRDALVARCAGCGWVHRPAYTSWECPMCSLAVTPEPRVLPVIERFGTWLHAGRRGLIAAAVAFAVVNLSLFTLVLWAYLSQ